MTLTTAPSQRRAVIDLGADATILDATRRLAAETAQEVVVVAPAGAPLARNAVFLDVLRRRAGDRRIVLVSSDARARSLAASVHLRAFTSLAALERHELDATEHLSDARRAALATIAATGAPRGMSAGRALAVFLSLLTAASILLAVIGPSATIVMTATPSPFGPFEYDLRAGPSGDIQAQTLNNDKISARATGTATDSKTEEIKAIGIERFTNLTTQDIRIAKGTIVQTPNNIRFQTTEDKVLPKSTLIPFNVSTVTISIEALEPGPNGNVPADRITQDSSPDYTVTNPVQTLGGETRKIPIVKQADYDLAVSRSDDALKRAAEEWTKQQQSQAAKGKVVYGVAWHRTGVSPATDVVGKQGSDTFEITVTGTATAYTVDATEPRAAAVKKLRLELAPGMDIDDAAVVVDTVIPAAVADDGVHWRVRARGQQFASPKKEQMTAALVGRGFEDVAKIAKPLGFEVVRVTPWPSWWPRLPVLDSRITIEITTAAATGSP